MIRALVEQTFDATKKYFVLAGLSTDSKPTTGIVTGSKFIEVDTGTNFAFDEVSGTWSASNITMQDIKDEIDSWLDDNIDPDSGYALDRTLSLSNAAAPADMVGDLKSDKPDKDGSYIDLTAGNAEFLLSDRGDTDSEPYVFRKTGGAKKAYNREMLRKIVGGTVVWNQLMKDPTFTNNNMWTVTSNATISVSNNIGKATCNTDGNMSLQPASNNNIKANHIYFIEIDARISNSNKFVQISTPFSGIEPRTNSQNFTRLSMIGKRTSNYSGKTPALYESDAVSGDYIEGKNFVFFDLTIMFGSTIADAIYAMERANAGSGVAFFRSLFPNDYYAYDAGTLMSVHAKEHRTVGKNLFDENRFITEGGLKKDNIGYYVGSAYAIYQHFSLGNTCFWANNIGYTGRVCITYEGYVAESGKGCRTKIFYTDGTSSDVNILTTTNSVLKTISTDGKIVEKICFTYSSPTTVYLKNFCISLSLDGKYEPYTLHSYPLDSSLILRGIPKWDSTNGVMYYDGDEYTTDGVVKRKYGILTNQTAAIGDTITLTGAKSDLTDIITTVGHLSDVGTISGIVLTLTAALSGADIIYELATPATETADPFRELEVCSRYGTEEFIDAGVTASTPTRDVAIPVGTETFYPVNVFDYIEELTQPDADYIADANIPSGKYFMVGNTLYLSTAAIAQGAAITPGTNCTETNLAEALNTINA